MMKLIRLFSSLPLLLLLSADLTTSASAPAPAPGSIYHPAVSPPESPDHGPPVLPPALSPPESPDHGSPPLPPSPVPVPAPPANVPPRPPPSSGSSGNSNARDGGGGMTAGQKAGVTIGVIAAAGVVGLGGFVYKKRRANIRRSRYGYAARRPQL